MFKKTKKQKSNLRQPSVGYKKQQIYSYRSVRNDTNKKYDRDNDLYGTSGSGIAYSALKFSKIMIGLLVIVGSFYMLSVDPNPRVEIKENSDALSRSNSSYSDGIKAILNESFLNKNKLTIDTKNIEDSIVDAFPEIGLAKVTIPAISHRPKVDIFLSKPVAKLITENQVYILDDNGRALFTEKDASDSLNLSSLITVNDSTGSNIIIGKPALSIDQLQYIQQIFAQADKKNLDISTVALSSSGSGINVNYSNFDYTVKYSFFADARQSSGAYFAIKDSLDKDPTEYIDVRIPDKVYVK